MFGPSGPPGTGPKAFQRGAVDSFLINEMDVGPTKHIFFRMEKTGELEEW